MPQTKKKRRLEIVKEEEGKENTMPDREISMDEPIRAIAQPPRKKQKWASGK